MDQRIKKLWVQALRSGGYTQTTGHLHDDRGFCCLGVLCDLAFKERLTLQRHQLSTGSYVYNGEEGLPPAEVCLWAGLQDNGQFLYDPVVRYDNLLRSLASLNDDGIPFDEIADLIEEKF